MKDTQVIINDLVAQYDPETLTLLKEAMEQKKVIFHFGVHTMVRPFLASQTTHTGVCTIWVFNQILLDFVASGGKSLNLDSLTSFNVAKLPDAKVLAQDILRRIQELQLKHWGHKDTGVLPEDTIQQLLLGANSILDIALTIEKEAISLKQQGL